MSNRKQRRLADRSAADKARAADQKNEAATASERLAARQAEAEAKAVLDRERAALYKAAVSRQNSLASTGPVTKEGKDISKMNALSHGLTARNPVLPTENQSAYEAHKALWLAELDPVTFAETRLALIVVDTEWRLLRIPAIEDKLAYEDIDSVKLIKALDNLSRHESRLRRASEKALNEFWQLKSRRRNLKESNPLDASSQQAGFVLQDFLKANAEIRHYRSQLPELHEEPANSGTIATPEDAAQAA